MFELTPDEWIAVRLSLKIALVATVVALPLGVAVGWLLARTNFWGKTLLDGVVHLLPQAFPRSRSRQIRSHQHENQDA